MQQVRAKLLKNNINTKDKSICATSLPTEIRNCLGPINLDSREKVILIEDDQNLKKHFFGCP